MVLKTGVPPFCRGRSRSCCCSFVLLSSSSSSKRRQKKAQRGGKREGKQQQFSSSSSSMYNDNNDKKENANLLIDESSVNESAKHWVVIEDFYQDCEVLYETFQRNQGLIKGKGGGIKGERFAWDYWHVENQYTQLRTPGDAYFEENGLCNDFREALVKYSSEN